MPCTPLGTLTTYYSLCKPVAGETGWAEAINGNWDTIDTQLNALVSTTPRSYLAGLSLINNGRTSLDVQIGFAIATDQSTQIPLTSVLTKNLASAWVVGSGNGGLFSGSATVDTWYHVFLIRRTDTNITDAGFDTSQTAANIPANYTAYRRIGSVKTASASSDLIKFIQQGDVFFYQLATVDSSVNNPGTGDNARTLNVPPVERNISAIVSIYVNTAATNATIRVRSALQSSQPVGTSLNLQAQNTASGDWGARMVIPCSSAQTIATRWSASGADNNERITTEGYIDRRGRDA